MTTDLETLGKAARRASRQLVMLDRATKDRVLLAIADALIDQRDVILAANAEDMEAARAAGTNASLLDRMLLTPQRLEAICSDVRSVALLDDPVGEVFDQRMLANGLKLHKRRIPLGVVAMVYEARPNVTVDAATLCLKTGNAVILRGGSDIRHSCAAVTEIMQKVLADHGLPAAAIQSITDPDRELVRELIRLDKYVDVIIPRGGAGLHRFCIENATIPVITGGIGVCHMYVDATADVGKAIPIIVNAKVQRPSVCNALDTLLVERAIAPMLLPALAAAIAPYEVELRPDPEALAILSSQVSDNTLHITPSQDQDFGTEFMALILSIRMVDGLDSAIEHIATYGSGHSEAILTNDQRAAQHFVQSVDASAVIVNASTRFNDGAQFGLGAEIAVSTQKLHARGPMALQELTTYKWVGEGDWLVRA